MTTRFYLSCLTAIAAVTLLFCSPAATAQGPPAAPVVVVRVVEQKLRTGQTFVGTIHPEQRATIGSAVDGRVVRYPINEGDRVENGQTLAELLTETIKLELEAAQGELLLRSEELAELENGTREEEIAQARAQLLAAKTAVTLGGKRLERIRTLIKSGTATDDELDVAQAAVDNARAVMDERQAALDLAVAGPRPERIAQAGARVAIQDSIVRKLSDQITKHTMVARFDAYVVTEHTEIGEWVNRGDPVAEIVGIDRVIVLASVLETHVPFISLGMDARVEVAALPDRVFIGKVVILVPQGDQRTRTFPVKILLNNEFTGQKPLLNVGMMARVTLPTGAEKTVRLVPKDALVLGGPQPMVYVVSAGEDNARIVQPVPVRLGSASGALVEVDGDLQAEQLVVVQGNERLRPGQAVNILREASPQTFSSTATLPADRAQEAKRRQPRR